MKSFNTSFALSIFQTLKKTILKSYDNAINDVVKLNKKNILHLSENAGLFDKSYTAIDEKYLKLFMQRAFTVATVGAIELEDKLKKLAANIIKTYPEGGLKLQGKSISPQDLFAITAKILIEQYTPVEKQIPNGWLRTNINTASSASYSAAQYNRTSTPDMKELYPYWQFKTREDSRVRPEHEMLDNRIYSSTDKIWETIYPPLGWNCRCYITPLTLTEVSNIRITPEPIIRPPSEDKRIIDTIPKEFQKNPALDFSGFDKYIKDSMRKFSTATRNELKDFTKSNKDLLNL
jgi:SPP1 gp7 family putative phage head morphogenesis protein